MKINREKFLQGLKIVNNITVKQGIKPAFESVFLKIKDNELILQTTNGDLYITNKIECESNIEEEFILNGNVLLDLIDNIHDEFIVIEKDKNQIKLKTKKNNIKLNTYVLDFPCIEDNTEYKKIDINVDNFSDILKKISFVSIKNDLRIELSGVYFDLDKNITIVSTDSGRIVRKIIDIECPDKIGLNFPKITIDELSRISLIEDVNSFEFFVDKSLVLIKLGNTEIRSKLIEVDYPDYNSAIPNEFLFEIDIDRDELLRALKLNSVVLDEYDYTIEFAFTENNLKISSKSNKFGNIDNDIEIKDGKECTIKLNNEYLIEGLEKFDTGNVKLKVTDNLIYICSKDNDYSYLLSTLII